MSIFGKNKKKGKKKKRKGNLDEDTAREIKMTAAVAAGVGAATFEAGSFGLKKALGWNTKRKLAKELGNVTRSAVSGRGKRKYGW